MGLMLTILRSADKRGAFLRTTANEHLHHPWATIHPFGGTSPAKRTPHPALHHLRLGMEVDVGFQSVPCSGWRTLFLATNSASSCSIGNTGAS